MGDKAIARENVHAILTSRGAVAILEPAPATEPATALCHPLLLLPLLLDVFWLLSLPSLDVLVDTDDETAEDIAQRAAGPAAATSGKRTPPMLAGSGDEERGLPFPFWLGGTIRSVPTAHSRRRRPLLLPPALWGLLPQQESHNGRRTGSCYRVFSLSLQPPVQRSSVRFVGLVAVAAAPKKGGAARGKDHEEGDGDRNR